MSRSTEKNPDADRFGGPGSSHQDREHPGRNGQTTGHKGGGGTTGPAPGEPTNTDHSRLSGGGGERDVHHTHDPATKS
jgi:hypothetical protein